MSLVTLLHFENSGTTITDAVPGNVWTASGGATQSTVSPITGLSSLDLSSAEGGVSCTTPAVINNMAGARDWRIDIRIKGGAAPPFFFTTLFGSNVWNLNIRNSNELDFEGANSGNRGSFASDGLPHLLTASFVNSTQRVYLFIDGTLVANVAYGAGFSVPTVAWVGKSVGASTGWRGKLDEFRYLINESVTASFVDDGLPFPGPGGTPGTATPAGVSAAWAFSNPSATGKAIIVPAGVAATWARGTPTATGKATTTPAGVGATWGFSNPSAVGGAIALPPGVAAAWTFSNPAAIGGAVALPAGVGAAWAVGQATASGGAVIPGTATPAGVSAAWSQGAATAIGGARANPPGVAAAWAMGTPSATGGAVAAPQGVGASWAVGQATASGGTVIPGVATPAGVGATWAVGATSALGAAAARPAGVGAAWSVGTPSATAGAYARPAGVGATWAVGQATASTGIRIVFARTSRVLTVRAQNRVLRIPPQNRVLRVKQ